MTEAYEEFLGGCPEYASTDALDALRIRDYQRLDDQHQVYLDYTGGSLHAESQVVQHAALLNAHIFGNPHSASPSSRGMTTLVEQARQAVLEWFNAPPDEYSAVFTANATGALKHVFDLLHKDSLAGKPAVLAATGGSALHGLVTEHQLRPLLAFFGAHTVPTSLYATEADFTAYRIANAALARRIERAAAEAATLLALPGGTRPFDAVVLAADRDAGVAPHGNARVGGRP